MANEKIKLLFVGETWAVTKIHTKGFDVVQLGGFDDYSVYLKNALRQYPDIEITHIPNHLVLSEFPQSLDELKKFDAMIVSDTGRNTLTMYADMFTVPMGPDRLSMIEEYVKGGGGFIMAGGYVCFQGFQEKGNYHGSEIETLLPVQISDRDDRAEATAGVAPRVVDQKHPIMKGIPGDKWPLFLGYNRIKAKEGASVLALCAEDDTFIAVWEYGKGRTMAFASDLAPHWGEAFVDWEFYPAFWHQAIKWVARRI
jgi:uncharacterized membrane protein